MNHLIRILPLALLLLFAFGAKAEVFVVTSNQDSGPGTLREALQKAADNGDAEADYIHFNLPGNSLEARTITILSEMPWVTSNLVLDATTQPGSTFGASDAKVRITVEREVYRAVYHDRFGGSNPGSAAFFLASASDVSIYGFYFINFHSLPTAIYAYNLEGSGITLHGAKRVQIGSPGKGNAFEENDYGIHAMHYLRDDFEVQDTCADVKIQSNLFDMDILERRQALGWIPSSMRIIANDVTIGGNNPLEGNATGMGFKIYDNNFSIINNDIHGSLHIEVGKNGMIKGNDFHLSHISLWNPTGKIEFHANRNISSIDNPQPGFIPSESEVFIGSDNPADANTFIPRPHSIAITGVFRVMQNAISCGYPAHINNISDSKPTIEVLVNNDTEFSGTATPNSSIYVYEDNSDCEICSPLVFLTTILTSAEGRWRYNGDFRNRRLLANAVFGNESSHFTQIGFESITSHNPTNVILVHPDCKQNNGSIELINYFHTLRIEWFNVDGRKVGEGDKVTGLPTGRYTAVLHNGNCSMSYQFELNAYSIVFFDDHMTVRNPSCGQNNGSISGLSVYASQREITKLEWRDSEANVLGTEPYHVGELGPGTYTLFAYISDDCFETYEVTLREEAGPTVDLSALVVTPITCNGPGSVSGIRISMPAGMAYHWLDEANQPVGGNRVNLTGITQPGTYRLALLGDAACDTVWAATVQIRESGLLRLDEGRVTVVPAGCDGLTLGRITGIQAENGSDYRWLDSENTLAGIGLELRDVPAGRYRLRATNQNGCEAFSDWYEVKRLDPTVFPTYAITERQPHCGADNGSLQIAYAGATVQPTALRWTDARGTTIGSDTEVSGLAPGTYHLLLTGENGCETPYRSFTLDAEPALTLNTAAFNSADDACGHGTGSITGLLAAGGRPPYRYSWANENDTPISQSADATALATGRYQLTVTDANGCQVISATYPILNTDGALAPPSPPEQLTLCTPGNVSIPYQGEANHRYRLYAGPQGGIALSEHSGIAPFQVHPEQTTTYYLSAIDGSCESPRVPVRVEISNAGIRPPNAFSPNGDGQYDTWRIAGLDSYPNARVSIFNRNGQLIFAQRSGQPDFDGRHKGNDLPIGAYFYLIDLGMGCDPLKGSLNLLR